ncbi:MAG: hypothetical protein GY785_01020 [Gammaproteobacteria bacterium]|nr:hypothetical protein [Gammaproteobacteria bacterium]
MEPVSEKNNLVYLVVSLVILLLAGALVDQFPSSLGQHILQAVTVITLASAFLGFRSSRLRIRTGVGFTISVLVIVILGVLLDVTGLRYLHLIVLVFFMAGRPGWRQNRSFSAVQSMAIKLLALFASTC